MNAPRVSYFITSIQRCFSFRNHFSYQCYHLKSSMPGRRCAIFGCNNSRVITKTKDPSIIYHTFPKGTISKKWITCCKRALNPHTATICSTHFTADDYERDLQNELLGLPLKRILKKTAIPTLNIPGKYKNDVSTSAREERYKKKEQKKIVKSLLRASSVDDGISKACSHDELVNEICLPNEILSMQQSSSENKPQHTTQIASPENETKSSLTSTLIQSLEIMEKKYNELMKVHNQLKTEFSFSKKRNQHKIKSLKAQLQYYKLKYTKTKYNNSETKKIKEIIS